jgi:hypothetical protein
MIAVTKATRVIFLTETASPLMHNLPVILKSNVSGNVTRLRDTKEGSKVFERFAVLPTPRTMKKP